MAQHLVVVVDAVKEHWQVQESSFINTNTQNLTLPLVFSALKAFAYALKLQNSENTVITFLALGPSHSAKSTPSCRPLTGSIWKASAQALCYINKQKTQSRLLLIQKSVINGEQELALNLMIAAQQLKVEIDGLAFSECEALAKTSAFTGGFYMRHSGLGIIQTMLQVYLPISRPRSQNKDFLPYCFCCKKQVDKAYVCSVCLALFCRYTMDCSQCSARLILPDSF